MLSGQKVKKYLWFVLRISIALAIVIFMISSNWKNLKDIFVDVRVLWLIAAVIVFFLHLCGGAVRWRLLLLTQGIKISFFETFALNMKAFFFSLVIPGGTLGGDFVKLGYVASRAPNGKKLESSFTILIDRVIGMLGMFSFGLVFALLLFVSTDNMNKFIHYAIIIFSAGAVGGIFASVMLFFHRKFEKIKIIKFFLDLADKYSKGKIQRLEMAMDLYKKEWKTLLKCFLISIVFINFALCIVYLFLAKGISSQNIPLITTFFGVVLGNVAGTLVPLPAGVGSRDAVVQNIFESGGIESGAATALPLLFSGLIVVNNILGGLFFVFDSKKTSMNLHKENSNLEN